MATTSTTTDVSGKSGADTVTGTDGSDRLVGGGGNDTMDGGAGSDVINAGSGNDVMIYNLSANLNGSTDIYTGGSGVDTVRMQLTQAQWLDPAVRQQLELYIAHLASVQRNSLGEVSNAKASDFVFHFANGTTLTVQMTERLQVEVRYENGQYGIIDHLASIVSGTATGTVIEAGGVNNANAPAGSNTASGDLYADDLDGADDAFQAVAAGAASIKGYGSYAVTAAGVWTYTLNNSHAAVQALNVGGTLIDSFNVLAADGTSQLVTVTIQGSNDAAVISGDSSGSLVEAGGVNNATAGTPSDSGDLNATDVDNANDAFHAVAVGGATANGYGTYTVTAAGVWTYTLSNDNAAVQALNVGDPPLTDSFTVLTVDGTSQQVTVTIHGANDAAVITGSSTAELTETDAAQSTGGDLDATDVDSSAAFVARTNVAGSNGYGKFSIDATGAWTYVMNNAHDEFVGGTDYTDSLTVATADGTQQVLAVTLHGTNDAAVITGSSTAELTETDAAQSAGGDLDATDVDSSAAFVARTNVAGSNGYGKFSIDATGTWTYTMNNAHDEFVGGTDYTDSLTVATADGTQQVLTVTLHGTNDAAVITGSSTAELTETNAAQSTGGDLDATDVDSSAAFVARTNVAGSNGYGKFSIDATGAWTYTMNNAHDEFVGGTDYTDSLTVATADGTQQVLTVTLHGTNDAAVISGSSTAELTETDAAQSTGGDLDATDVDSSAAFVARTNVAGSNGYGRFSIDATGAWTYTMNNAHNEFVGGTDYTDSLTVATADGTSQLLTVTLHGTNDAAVITGSSTAELTETNAAQSTGGDLDATDVDSSAAFVARTNVAGSNGYGKFSIDATGTWTYTMNNAHDEFVGGTDYTDSLTVATADGTQQVLTVTLHGTNDAAVISGSSTAELTETDAAQSTGGDLDATDVDSSAAFVARTNVAGSNGYGKFSIDATGTWTYTMNNAHNEFVGGQDYTDSLTVATADGTQQVLTVTIHGTDDNSAPTNITLTAVPADGALPDVGTLATLSTTDPDPGDSHTYSIVGAAGVFAINGNQLNITSDLANNSTYTVQIRSTDLAGASYQETFHVITGSGTGNTLPDPTVPGDPASGVFTTDDILYGFNNGDLMFGGSGDDSLFGQDGNDTLTGGSGADRFVFDSALNKTGVDTITDFESGTDRIVLSAAVFTALATGALAPAAFKVGSTFDASTRILYNASTGALSYDSDGSGAAAAAVQIAIIGTATHPTLTAADFQII